MFSSIATLLLALGLLWGLLAAAVVLFFHEVWHAAVPRRASFRNHR